MILKLFTMKKCRSAKPISTEHGRNGCRGGFGLAVKVEDRGVYGAGKAVMAHPQDYSAAFRESTEARVNHIRKGDGLAFLTPLNVTLKIASLATVLKIALPLNPPAAPHVSMRDGTGLRAVLHPGNTA